MIIKTWECEIKVPSAIVPLSVKISEMSVDKLLAFQNKELFDNLCKNGCKNYGKKWSCPPMSPSFYDYCFGYVDILVILLTVNTRALSNISNAYTRLRAANAIMRGRMNRVYRGLDSKLFISSGACRKCRSCQLQMGKDCISPSGPMYSFESLGLDVNELVRQEFNFELEWYSSDNKNLNTSIVFGLVPVVLDESVETICKIIQES